MEDNDIVNLQELEPAYQGPENIIHGDVSFNVDYYKSHYVPIRETIELRKATND